MRFKRLMVLASLTLSGCVTVTELPQSTATEMADARIELGLSYLQQGNRSKARENLYRARQHAEEYYRAQLALAHYFDQVGDIAAARKLYQQAARQHPSNGDVLNNFGVFLCKQTHYKAAESWFKRALQQPDYHQQAATLENAALCAEQSGNKRRAVEYFSRTVEYDPARTSAWLQLIRLQIQLGEKSAAHDTARQFRHYFGSDSGLIDMLWDQTLTPDPDRKKSQR